MTDNESTANRFDQLRKKAEELISARPDNPTEGSSSALDLINELEIHQVELEIQNEELKQAQKELSALHRGYEELYEFAPCGYVTLNAKGMITRANLTAVALLGVDRSALLQSGFIQFISPEKQGAFIDAGQEAGRTGEKRTVRVSLNRNDPATLWVRIDIVADREETGAVTRWRMALTDITERKTAEAELRESRNKYRTLFEDANDAIFLASADTGIILDANQKAEQLTGRPKNDIIGMHQTELHPTVQKETTMTAFRDEALNQKGNTYIHFHVQHKNGDLIPVEISQSMIEYHRKPCVLGIFRDVTEKRERIETLQRYEAVIKAVSDPISYVDRDYIYRIVSDAYLRYSGKPREAIIGQPVWEILGKEPFENIVRPYLDRCFEGETVRYEDWFSFPDGTWRYQEIGYFPVFDDDGKEVVGASAFSKDRTARKEAEQALRKKQNMLSHAEKMANIGSWELKIATNKVTWSDQLYHIFGFDPSSYAPRMRDARNRYHPDDFPALEQAMDAAVNACKPYKLELRIRRNDGSTRVCIVHGFPETGPDGRVVRLFGSTQDITERKQAEAALMESENRYRSIFRNKHMVMLVIDPTTGVIVDANPAATEYYGWSHEELTGANINRINTLSPEAIKKEMRAACQNHRSFFQFRHRLKDGTIRDVEVSSGPVHYGEKTLLYSMVRDVTRRKRAEAALQKSLAEKEILLREIHHRVKNNMQAISGLLRMHARRTDDAHLTEIFDDCRGRIGAMSLIHEALYQSDDLAKIDFGAYLKKLCRNLAQAHYAGRRGITLTASAADVSLDMDQSVAVGMIIAELISNAFKHAFPNDEEGTVAVGLDRPDGETVRLVVSDTGKGLPPDFDMSASRSLGMRLVWGAVTRELGGSIEATNDGGARFIIRFKMGNSVEK